MQIDPEYLRRSPLMYAMSVIDGKWKSSVIWHLAHSDNLTSRYGSLKRSMPYKISHRSFTDQLRELESDGIILRNEYDEVPKRVEYVLTDKGKSLANIIAVLRDWGALWGDYADTDVVPIKGDQRQEGIIYRLPDADRQMADEGESITWKRITSSSVSH